LDAISAAFRINFGTAKEKEINQKQRHTLIFVLEQKSNQTKEDSVCVVGGVQLAHATANITNDIDIL
jgi:hypothetical protein